MDWIIYSAVMFVFSIIYYLIIKKIQNLGIDQYVYMTANSIVPIFLFGILSLSSGKTFVMSQMGFIIVLITAILLNYFGSIAGYQGIKSAPNTGYSVIIQKSYALYTTFAAVLLFNSELPLYKLLGVLIIILFTCLIMIEKSNKKFVINKWFWYSLLAFFLFGGTTIAAKYIALIGDDPNVYLFWVMVCTAIISLVSYLKNKSKVITKFNPNIIFWLFVMSLSVSIFYWGKNMSTITTPNIGYTGAINAASNAVLTIVSAIIFKQELNTYKLIGVFGVCVGLVILIS